MERFKMIASTYLFLIQGGKILLSRRFQTGYEDGKYSLPAGHVEDNEPLTKSLVREVKEEIGVVIRARDVKLVHVMHRRESDIRMDFFFTVKRFRGQPSNCEPEKCDDLAWFSMGRLPPNTIPYIRAAIRNFSQGVFFSERGFPT